MLSGVYNPSIHPVSNKTFYRAFKNICGVSSSIVFKIIQFRKSLEKMKEQNSNKTICQLAHELGYYDQAHFNHTFRKLTDETPSNFFKAVSSVSEKNFYFISNNKYVFRFILIFFGLIIFPFPLTYIPYVNFIGVWISKFYKTIIPWLGNNVLGIQREISTEFTGSGDTTYGYLVILFYFCLAILGTIIWSLIVRREKDQTKLNYWFLTTLRYWVGAAIIFIDY